MGAASSSEDDYIVARAAGAVALLAKCSACTKP